MQIKDMYKQLLRFLNGEEEPFERRNVTSWYEQLPVQEQVDESTIKDIKEKTKGRIMLSVKNSQPNRTVRLRLIWSAAAAAIIVLGYFSYLSLNKSAEIASSTVLASVKPAKESARIILANGEEIDLDRIGLNGSIAVGETIIQKDGQGKISYHDHKTGKNAVQMNTLYIPKAATYQLTLTDGTRVRLNSDSKLTYPSSFDEGDRIVQLEGEAYFEVRKTSHKSRFIVESNRQRIQVLGTKFNVKAYTHDARSWTTLAEGSVRINKPGEGKTVLLKPSQQSVISDAEQIQTKTIVLEDVLSWTSNQFYFDGSNTEEVLKDIARWYDIDVQYDRKSPVGEYTGRIPRNISLDKLIELLNYAEMKVMPVMGKNNRINLIIT